MTAPLALELLTLGQEGKACELMPASSASRALEPAQPAAGLLKLGAAVPRLLRWVLGFLNLGFLTP